MEAALEEERAAHAAARKAAAAREHALEASLQDGGASLARMQVGAREYSDRHGWRGRGRRGRGRRGRGRRGRGVAAVPGAGSWARRIGVGRAIVSASSSRGGGAHRCFKGGGARSRGLLPSALASHCTQFSHPVFSALLSRIRSLCNISPCNAFLCNAFPCTRSPLQRFPLRQREVEDRSARLAALEERCHVLEGEAEGLQHALRTAEAKLQKQVWGAGGRCGCSEQVRHCWELGARAGGETKSA